MSNLSENKKYQTNKFNYTMVQAHQVPEELVCIGLEDWKRCSEEERLAKIAMITILRMPGQFENLCHVSEALRNACDSYGDGRLR